MNGAAPEGHRDAAAYALGVLEPQDALRCAEHLAACKPCAREHAAFAALASALAELVPPTEPAAGPPPVTARATVRRRRWAARAVAWPSVAAVLAVAVLLGDRTPEAVRFTTTDRATGVTASASLEDRGWGAEVGLKVTGLRGVCTLYAVDASGHEHPLATWRSEAGEAPAIETAAPLHPTDITHLTVRDAAGTHLADLRR
ncbi:hypothetical protein [Streptomyces tritici]|uniref:hypothetical protein n=1 Tax=Streptomyces tritici TaxID=2054410 RepID=UPI003AF10D21